MAVSRRTVLAGGIAGGALLLGTARHRSVAVPGDDTTLDAFGTSRRSRIFPGTMLLHADLHNHTLLSDGDGDEADAFASMRRHGLDVAALTDHTTLPDGTRSLCGCSSLSGIDEAAWQRTGRLADAAHEDGRFVAIRGFEWSSPTLGHMNVWFSQTWIDVASTAGIGLGEGLVDLVADLLPDELGPVLGAVDPVDALLGQLDHTTGLGMAGFYNWLRSAPDTPLLGGGADGIIGFNHPGREPGRFSMFAYDGRIADRLVSLEVFNRGEDYLFEAVDRGERSPIDQALEAGWRVGLIGVTDYHGDDWGGDPSRGRAGLWATALTRDAVREAMLARRLFATVVDGLRLDAGAASGGSDLVRMGSALPHDRGPVRFVVDVDRGPRWTGKRLGLQVLRPGGGGNVPVVAWAGDLVVPAADAPLPEVTVPVDRSEGSWVLLRLTDPDAEPDRRAPAPFSGFGGAVAYTSPWYLRPASTGGVPAGTDDGQVAGASAGAAPRREAGPGPGALPTTGGGRWVGHAAAAGAAALLARRAAVAAGGRAHTHADGTTHAHPHGH